MTIYRALAVLFLAGITLFLALVSSPHFSDAANWPWVEDADDAGFVEARERNRTVEGQVADFGLGVATLAISLAAAAALLGAGHRTISTPSRKWLIVIFANVALLATYVGEFVALARDQVRGEFPPWADTMAIPMEGFISGWKLVAPVMTVAFVVCLWNTRLPAALWTRPAGWVAWISTLMIGLVIGFELLALTEAVRYGKAFAIPGHMALIYCLLCGEAAVASRPWYAR
jgi:hypothetical protein